MRYNILLFIEDCLRFDRVTPQYMPFLTDFAAKNTLFTNYWSTSHNTDASITPMLTGLWPDELQLYSMMYGAKDYTISEDVEMLAQTAKKHGYYTGKIGPLGRWYERGIDASISNWGWRDKRTLVETLSMIYELPQPWFITIHDASCHSNYRGGDYDIACYAVDHDLRDLVGSLEHGGFMDNTFLFITSDHGEGLGEMGVVQHGYGLWPFLTHVPLVVHHPGIPKPLHNVDRVCQHVDLYHMLEWTTRVMPETWPPAITVHDYAHMVGYAPGAWHRAVTDGKLMAINERKTYDGVEVNWLGYDIQNRVVLPWALPELDAMWEVAVAHAARLGVEIGNEKLDNEYIEERLRNLGYWE